MHRHSRPIRTLQKGPTLESSIPAVVSSAIACVNVQLLNELRSEDGVDDSFHVNAEVIGLIRSLNERQLEQVAGCGLLLLDLERMLGGIDAERPGGKWSIAVLPVHGAWSLVQTAWMVAWQICTWNESVARLLLGLPAELTRAIATGGPRDWSEQAGKVHGRIYVRWGDQPFIWRGVIANHGRAVRLYATARGLQMANIGTRRPRVF